MKFGLNRSGTSPVGSPEVGNGPGTLRDVLQRQIETLTSVKSTVNRAFTETFHAHSDDVAVNCARDEQNEMQVTIVVVYAEYIHDVPKLATPLFSITPNSVCR